MYLTYNASTDTYSGGLSSYYKIIPIDRTYSYAVIRSLIYIGSFSRKIQFIVFLSWGLTIHSTNKINFLFLNEYVKNRNNWIVEIIGYVPYFFLSSIFTFLFTYLIIFFSFFIIDVTKYYFYRLTKRGKLMLIHNSLSISFTAGNGIKCRIELYENADDFKKIINGKYIDYVKSIDEIEPFLDRSYLYYSALCRDLDDALSHMIDIIFLKQINPDHRQNYQLYLEFLKIINDRFPRYNRIYDFKYFQQIYDKVDYFDKIYVRYLVQNTIKIIDILYWTGFEQNITLSRQDEFILGVLLNDAEMMQNSLTYKVIAKMTE